VNDGTVSDAAAGLYIWNSSRDSNEFYNSYVYNNTIYNSKVAAIRYSELSDRKAFAFYNNIFVGRDSLLKGNMGADVFLGNNWWRSRSQTEGELIVGKMKVLNRNPDFKSPDKKINLTSASGLKNFESYKIPIESPLRTGGINLHGVFGMNTGGMDFNSGKAPISGIGASF
jgi:hypothetical protein